MCIPNDYPERVYAGWYGKLIGIRHGALVEGWSYEKIAEKFGEVQGYLFDLTRFAADDDSNGPIFFIRALEDYACNESLTPRQMGETVLNYVPDEHGFFWWGGYGKSTEHTAYRNLAQGIPAPLSGSVELNGAAVAEQIGGQIFIEPWGLVNPCDYRRAARFAEKMASVTHGGNGVYGGMFIAACVSAAFGLGDVKEVIRAGLSVIPADCEYRRMADCVLAFHAAHPENWRDCFAYVKENFGYERYPGACHIIPNAAVVLLSLLYGNGSFSDAVNISVMCGWDTDCNAANVGCIMGVLAGLEGIDSAWREQIDDLLVCSSVLGCLNLRDVANDALYMASLGYRVAGEPFPERLRAQMQGTAPKFTFVFPESTHTFRSEGGACTFQNLPGEEGRFLRAAVEKGGEPVRVYRQTYYTPQDFMDDRYTPSFTPEIFPGQKARFCLRAESPVEIRLFLRVCCSGQVVYGPPVTLGPDWQALELGTGIKEACIDRVGWEVSAPEGAEVDILSLDYVGQLDYVLDFSKSGMAVWNPFYADLSQTSYSKGIWEIVEGAAYGSCADHGELFTGDVSFGDYTVEARIRPQTGQVHLGMIRAQGAMRGYLAGFWGDELVILKNRCGLKRLASVKFPWERGRDYALTLKAEGPRLTVSVGEAILSVEDREEPYLRGCYGFAVREGSRCRIDWFVVKGQE